MSDRITADGDELARAVSYDGDKRVKRTALADTLTRMADSGRLRLSSLLAQPEPQRTWAMEILTDVEDANPKDWGLRDVITVRVLVGKASAAKPSTTGRPATPLFRWKTSVRETHPAPRVVRWVKIVEEHAPGSIVDMATVRAALLLPRHGYGLEEAQGVKHVHVLELGYSYMGRYTRTVTDEQEADFRATQGLPAIEDDASVLGPPAPALPAEARRQRREQQTMSAG